MTISVVIPAHNEQDVLSACLDALTNQTRHFDEIIVVDNNSTDQTATIAQSYGVTVIKEKQQGIMPTVHTGMNACTSDIIARCDADSIVPRNWAETIEESIQSNPKAAGITGPGTFYGTSSLRARLAQICYMYPYFLLVGSALANWPLFGSNCAIRRTVWQDIQHNLHRNRTDIHDDMEISAHIPPTQPIIFMPSLVVGISARSLCFSSMSRRHKRGWKSLTLHWPASSPWRRWRARLNITHI